MRSSGDRKRDVWRKGVNGARIALVVDRQAGAAPGHAAHTIVGVGVHLIVVIAQLVADDRVILGPGKQECPHTPTSTPRDAAAKESDVPIPEDRSTQYRGAVGFRCKRLWPPGAGAASMCAMVEIDRNDMVVLEREECMRRLGRTGVGRIALVAEGLPMILPVNYSATDQYVYFLAGPGSKLDAATRGEMMAFEVDHQNAFEHGGWSVLVVGPASVVPESEMEPLWNLKLGRWAGGGPGTQVRIRTDRVSGREIGRPGVNGWVPEFLRKPAALTRTRRNRSGGSGSPFRALRP